MRAASLRSISTTASIMFQLAYGYQLRGDHDQYYMEAKKAIEHIMSSVMFTSEYCASSDVRSDRAVGRLLCQPVSGLSPGPRLVPWDGLEADYSGMARAKRKGHQRTV